MKWRQFIFGILGGMIFIGNASATTFYVDVNSTNPTPPYTNWSTASTDIQRAVDASSDGDLILVTNGIYRTGGRVVYGSLTNRVAINKAVTVQSVNGPTATLIQGYKVAGTITGNNAVRCVYLTNNAVLVGFTLTNGACRSSGNILQEQSGGGIWCESSTSIVSNCTLSGNTASIYGGGACGGILLNCTIISNTCPYAEGEGSAIYNGMISNCIVIGNQAYQGAAAIYQSTAYGSVISSNSGVAVHSVLIGCLATANFSGPIYCTNYNCIFAWNSRGMFYGIAYNCLVISNTSFFGGGAEYGSLYNCAVIGNVAHNNGGGVYAAAAFNCIIYGNSAPSGSNYYGSTLNYCDTTPLASGLGNITNDPAFVSLAGGDYHLQSNSPCINAGNNAAVTSTNDYDGNPRIVGGTVDIGAYEYQTPSSILSYAWAQQYGLPTDGSADFLDSDGTGLNNWQKWIAGLNPTNAASVFELQTPAVTVTNATLTWSSVTNVTYYVQRSSDLSSPNFSSIQSNLVGQAGFTSYTDTSATNGFNYYYRVGVQ